MPATVLETTDFDLGQPEAQSAVGTAEPRGSIPGRPGRGRLILPLFDDDGVMILVELDEFDDSNEVE